jgi:hypothetical protein
MRCKFVLIAALEIVGVLIVAPKLGARSHPGHDWIHDAIW